METLEQRTSVIISQIKRDIAALKMLSEGIEQQRVSRETLHDQLTQVDTHLKQLCSMLDQ